MYLAINQSIIFNFHTPAVKKLLAEMRKGNCPQSGFFETKLWKGRDPILRGFQPWLHIGITWVL